MVRGHCRAMVDSRKDQFQPAAGAIGARMTQRFERGPLPVYWDGVACERREENLPGWSACFAVGRAVLAGLICLGSQGAAAQEASSAPVTMTVGFGAGERPDLYGRILGR